MTKGNDKPKQPAAKAHVRNIKVGTGTYTRTIKDKDHSHFDQTVYRAVPKLQIQGLWLEQAGFAINTPLKVRGMQSCLVITAESHSGGS